jgi:hypothetical protein
MKDVHLNYEKINLIKFKDMFKVGITFYLNLFY